MRGDFGDFGEPSFNGVCFRRVAQVLGLGAVGDRGDAVDGVGGEGVNAGGVAARELNQESTSTAAEISSLCGAGCAGSGHGVAGGRGTGGTMVVNCTLSGRVGAVGAGTGATARFLLPKIEG